MNEIQFYQAFNIPENLKHDHSEESINQMREGISKLNILLEGQHEKCIEHVIIYAELNIKFLFAANLLKDKNILKNALDLFIENIIKLFLRK